MEETHQGRNRRRAGNRIGPGGAFGRCGPVVLAALLAAGGWATIAAAHPDAGAAFTQSTPAAQADCEVPATPPAGSTTTSRPGATPASGTPRAAIPVIAPGTVAATPAATPDPEAVLTAELTAVARALASCLSAG